jgi:hypothetical protein
MEFAECERNPWSADPQMPRGLKGRGRCAGNHHASVPLRGSFRALQFCDLIYPGLRSFAYGETRCSVGLAPTAFQADCISRRPPASDFRPPLCPNSHMYSSVHIGYKTS